MNKKKIRTKNPNLIIFFFQNCQLKRIQRLLCCLLCFVVWNSFSTGHLIGDFYDLHAAWVLLVGFALTACALRSYWRHELCIKAKKVSNNLQFLFSCCYRHRRRCCCWLFFLSLLFSLANKLPLTFCFFLLSTSSSWSYGYFSFGYELSRAAAAVGTFECNFIFCVLLRVSGLGWLREFCGVYGGLVCIDLFIFRLCNCSWLKIDASAGQHSLLISIAVIHRQRDKTTIDLHSEGMSFNLDTGDLMQLIWILWMLNFYFVFVNKHTHRTFIRPWFDTR